MIRTRLTLWNCVILTLVLSAVGAAIYLATRQSLLASIDNDLARRADLMTATWRGLPGPGMRPPPNRPPPGRINLENAKREGIDPIQVRQVQLEQAILRPMLLDLNGKPLMNPSERPWDLEGLLRAARTDRRTYGQGELLDLPLRTISQPMKENGRAVAIVQFASSLAGVDAELSRLARTLAFVLPLAVVAMMFTGILLTRRALRPMAEIAAAAERIEATNLESRLPAVGKDEFAYLSTTFNGMLDRLEDAFAEKEVAAQRQRQFVSDASHELKTPLTAIRVRTGVALNRDLEPERYREHLLAIDRAAVTMSALVQDLLLLASSDEGKLKVAFEPIDVGEMLNDAVEAVDFGNHDFHLDIEGPPHVVGDRFALTRVIVNLLDNAARYSPQGSAVSCHARAVEDGVAFQVKDAGPGIPEEHIPRIFDRFYRVDSSRDRQSGGTGLGLAIAKAIVDAHGGSIRFDSQVGRGTTVTITLPNR